MVAKRGDGGKDLSKCRGSVGLALKKNGDNRCSGVAHCSKDVAVAGGVWSRSRAPYVQSQGVKRVRRITITSRASIDVRNCGLGNGTVRAKRERSELGEAEDAMDTEAVELEKACFMKVTHAAMDEVTSRSSNIGEKGWRDVRWS